MRRLPDLSASLKGACDLMLLREAGQTRARVAAEQFRRLDQLCSVQAALGVGSVD